MIVLWRVSMFLVPALLLASKTAAADDAEILSRRVPKQAYKVFDTFAILHKSGASWGIPLWACDPNTLTISKVLGKSAPAPYAIKIKTGPHDPIDEVWSGRRLQAVHLLAASLEDAVKMRRALVLEIETMQRFLEKRQGNRPGYLKEKVRASKR